MYSAEPSMRRAEKFILNSHKRAPLLPRQEGRLFAETLKKN